MSGLSLPPGRHLPRRALHELLPLDPRYKKEAQLREDRANAESRDRLGAMLDECRLELTSLIQTDWAVEKATQAKLSPLSEVAPKAAGAKGSRRRRPSNGSPARTRMRGPPEVPQPTYISERGTIVTEEAWPYHRDIRRDVVGLRRELAELEGRRGSEQGGGGVGALRNAPAVPPASGLPTLPSPTTGQVAVVASPDREASDKMLASCVRSGLVGEAYVTSRRAEQAHLSAVQGETQREISAHVEAMREAIQRELDDVPRSTPARWRPRPACNSTEPPPPTLAEMMESQRKDIGDAPVDNDIFRLSSEMSGIHTTQAMEEEVTQRAHMAMLQREVDMQRAHAETLREQYARQVALDDELAAQRKAESRIRRKVRLAESRAVQYDRNMRAAQGERRYVSDEVERARRELQLLEHEDRWFPASERTMAAEERRLTYLLHSAASKTQARQPHNPVCRKSDLPLALDFPRSQSS